MKRNWIGKKGTGYMVRVAMLSAIAAVLMYLDFKVPLMPPFLKMDFSEMPAFLAAFSLGPAAGVLVVLIKNIVHLFVSSTLFVGELANFFVGTALVLTAGVIYKYNKSRKGALLGMAGGTVLMLITAVITNIYLTIPLYLKALELSLEDIIGWCQAVNPAIKDLTTLMVIGIVPFNLLKAIVVSFITYILYKRISRLLHY